MGREEVDISPSEDLVKSVTGRSIVGGGVAYDGLHLELDDGRYLVFLGVIALCPLEKSSLQ